MTKEERIAILRFVINTINIVLDRKAGTEEDRNNFIGIFKDVEGQNEYTLKFFPNGDKEILDTFTQISPVNLEECLEDLSNVSGRAYLEGCCRVADGLTRHDPKC